MLGGKIGEKNGWVLLLMLLSGVVLGGFIGQTLAPLPYFGWLAYGRSFGLETPVKLDLGVVSMQFGFMLRISVAGVIGMAAAFFIYRRVL